MPVKRIHHKWSTAGGDVDLPFLPLLLLFLFKAIRKSFFPEAFLWGAPKTHQSIDRLLDCPGLCRLQIPSVEGDRHEVEEVRKLGFTLAALFTSAGLYKCKPVCPFSFVVFGGGVGSRAFCCSFYGVL